MKMSGLEDAWYSASESGASAGSTPVKKAGSARVKQNSHQNPAATGPSNKNTQKCYDVVEDLQELDDWGSDSDNWEPTQQHTPSFHHEKIHHQKAKQTQDAKRSGPQPKRSRDSNSKSGSFGDAAYSYDSPNWQHSSSPKDSTSTYMPRGHTGVEEIKAPHRTKSQKQKKSPQESPPCSKVLLNGSAGAQWSTMPAKLSPGTPLLPMTPLSENTSLSPSDGHPVPILVQNEDTSIFELDEEALASVLLAPGVEDKHVCVLAVAGAFRKGKSFLLDFLLRYCANRDCDDWLGDPARPLKGFKWRQGSKRETTGILVWSKPFIVTRKTGEQIAVILMDTQGTFDTQSSMKDSTVVFALTMMVSSVLVYNLMNNIQEDDLMNLQTFTSYGIQAQEDCDTSHAFQRLQFLVRDWGFPYETPYGHKGGQAVLDEILQITPKQHPAHQDVRRDLRKCFRDINCYLMPHPGFKVIQYANFDGRLADIEDEFLKHLRVLVPRLLAPENLVKKEFGGQPIKARDLYNFFKTFMEVFKDIDLPEPTTLVEFAARASSQAALEAGKELYTEAMDTLVGGDRPFLKTVQMEAEHEKEKLRAVASYLEKNKYGRKNQRVVEKYQTQLEEEIDKLFLKYVEQNEAKNVFKAARTPATLFSVLMLFYLLSGIFGVFGLYPVASICNMGMGAFLVMLTLWAYVRYSGEYRDVGIYIDEVASFLWENLLQPIYCTYMEKPLKDAAEQAAHQAMSSAITAPGKAASNNNTSKPHKS